MSTAIQEDSPARQRSLIEQYLKGRDYRVTHEYEDLAGKGWDETRPGLQKLIKAAANKEFDVVIVDEWSRLTRADLFVTVSDIIRPLRDAGVVLDTVRDGVKNWNDIAGQVMLVVDTYKSESETKETARRTLSELMRTAREGKLFLGPTPFGYSAEEEEGKKGRKKRVRFIPGDPAEIEIVRWIFESYANRGMGVVAIAQELHKKNYPAPGGKGWHSSAVRTIITNPVYAGHYSFNRNSRRRFAYFQGGKVEVASTTPSRKLKLHKNDPKDVVVIPNTHEPLVSQELWDRAQEMRTKRRTQRTPSQRTVRYLSGILHCYHCKRVMYHQVVLKKFHRMRCGTEMRRLPGWGTCKCYQVDEEVVLERILSVVQAELFNATNTEKYAAYARSRSGPDTTLRTATEKKLKRLEERIERGYDNLTETPKHMAAKLIARIQTMEGEVQTLKRQLAESGHDHVAEADNNIIASRKFHEVMSHLKEERMGEINAALRMLVKRAEIEFVSVSTKNGKKERHKPFKLHITLHS